MTADELARSALAGREDDLDRVGARELAFLAQVDVRVGAADGLPRVDPNTWVAEGDREWLWLGPDERLVVAPPGSAPAIAEDLPERLADVHHSVVDVSASRAVIELSGPQRLERLARGCGLDLHPRTWRSGRCAQTLLARVPLLLQERGDATRVFVRSSFAGSLVDWLLETGSA